MAWGSTVSQDSALTIPGRGNIRQVLPQVVGVTVRSRYSHGTVGYKPIALSGLHNYVFVV